MKRSLYFIVLLLLLVRLDCRASNVINQTLITNIPSAIEVTTLNSANSGTINPENGMNSGVSAKFQIITNAKNRFYDYVLQAKVATDIGTELNAYGNTGRSPFLVFGNISNGNFPTEVSINNAQNNPQKGNNPNAIAYPSAATVEAFRRIRFLNDPMYGGYCYQINIGKSNKGFVNQLVGTSPVNNTYFYGEDKPGVYQVVITLSALRKP